MAQRICLVSGGTGGHLMPALVLARAMPEHGLEPMLVTEGRDVERELVRRELPGVDVFELPRSRGGAAALPLWLVRATATARRLLRKQAAAGVVSTGGRASVPVALAAKSLGLPLYLLEQNAVTGRANRWLLPIARRLYLGLPSAHESHPRALRTGTPLRPGFGSIDRVAARRSLGLAADAPVVVVTGGSQGARVLNELVPEALAAAAVPLQVLHLSGLGNDTAVRHRYSGVGSLVAQVRPVAADMDRLFAAADLVICRGGGTTVAELMVAGRPAVVVPYPHHKDRQQFHNAQVLAAADAAVVVEEAGIDAATFATVVRELLRDARRLDAMGRNAKSLAGGVAAERVLVDLRATLVDREPAPGPRPSTVPPGSVRAPARRGGVA